MPGTDCFITDSFIVKNLSRGCCAGRARPVSPAWGVAGGRFQPPDRCGAVSATTASLVYTRKVSVSWK